MRHAVTSVSGRRHVTVALVGVLELNATSAGASGSVGTRGQVRSRPFHTGANEKQSANAKYSPHTS